MCRRCGVEDKIRLASDMRHERERNARFRPVSPSCYLNVRVECAQDKEAAAVDNKDEDQSYQNVLRHGSYDLEVKNPRRSGTRQDTLRKASKRERLMRICM